MGASVRQNFILAAVMVVGSVVLWIASLDLRPESAFFPRLLLTIIIGCALTIAGAELLRMRAAAKASDASEPPGGADTTAVATTHHERESPERDDALGRRRQWLIAAALVTFVLAFVYVGPYTAVFALLTVLYVLLTQVRTWKTVLIGGLIALALTAVLYGLFTVGLNVSVPHTPLM